MLQNLTNFFSLISGKQVKTSIEPNDLIVLGTKDARYNGGYKPSAIRACDLGGGGSGVEILGTGTCSTYRCAVSNIASGPYSASLGGQCNTAGGTHTFVGGGFSNCAVGCAGTVAGGTLNVAGTGAGSSCCCLLGDSG